MLFDMMVPNQVYIQTLKKKCYLGTRQVSPKSILKTYPTLKILTYILESMILIYIEMWIYHLRYDYYRLEQR